MIPKAWISSSRNLKRSTIRQILFNQMDTFFGDSQFVRETYLVSEWFERRTNRRQFLNRLGIVDRIAINWTGGCDLYSVSHNTVDWIELNIDGFEMYWLIGGALDSSWPCI